MSQNNPTLLSVLKQVGKSSCPHITNLHTHTTCSDGSLSPESLIQIASRQGLRNLAITDHHSINAYTEINRFNEDNQTTNSNLENLFTGVEISCLLKKCLVHVVALGFDIKNKNILNYCRGEAPIGKYLQADYLINVIHESGGYAILAHPARYRLGFKELIEECAKIGFDGAEAWYDYEHKSLWSPTPLICESVDKLLKSYGLLSSCGTDCHGLHLNGR